MSVVMTVLIIFVVVWLFLCALVGEFAHQRGRNGGSWFFLAVLISPLFAVLFLIAAGDARQQRSP